jgi:hypothetical protein
LNFSTVVLNVKGGNASVTSIKYSTATSFDGKVAMEALEFEMMAPVERLPQVQPKYHVPHLVDKPQNPIMDALYLNRAGQGHIASGFHPPPLERVIITGEVRSTQCNEDGNLWQHALRTNTGNRVSIEECILHTNIDGQQNQSQVKSWDGLRLSHHSRASSTPFLSEQSRSVFTAAQYQ